MTQKHRTPQHEINPDCAATFATLEQQMVQVSKIQAWVVETLRGNGRPGLIQDHNALALAVHELTEAHKLEVQTREKEAHERRTDNRKWWLGLATLLITSILAVMQTITIAITLSKLAVK